MLTFNKKSWHYRLAKFWCEGLFYKIEKNICGYCRQVFFGFLLFLFFTALAITYLTLCVVLPLVYAIASIQTGIWADIPHPVQVGICVDIVIVILIASYSISKFFEWKERKRELLYQQMNSENYIPPKDNFIVEAYKSFKEKTCIKIEFE